MSTVVGRTSELETIRLFIGDATAKPSALLIEGVAGIGKTTLWEWALSEAGPTHRILSSRPAEGESAIPLAGLVDLLGDVPEGEIDALPEPQRRALRVALLRESDRSGDEPLDRLALSLAVLGTLERLAASHPVTLALDDVQWLDRSTEEVVAFVVRRARDLPLRLLVTRRTDGSSGVPLELDRSIPEGRLTRIPLGPLSPEDIDRMVRDRLGVQVPRPTLIELHRVTEGNPLYALEVARLLVRERGDLAPGSLPVPEDLEAVLRTRLETLSQAARDALLHTALSDHPSVGVVEAAAGSVDGIEESVRAEILDISGDRVRFTHPLFGSVVERAALPWQTRDAHRRLAGVVTSVEERALHGARSAEPPDEETAGEAEEAARHAAGLGAPQVAARLADEAVRLTDPGDAESWGRRMVDAAEHHLAAGDPGRGRRLLERLAAELPPGPARAEVLWRLSTAVGDDIEASRDLCHRALAEAGDDDALASRIHLELATYEWLLGNLEPSADECREAARLAERAGDVGLLAAALAEVAHADVVLGRPFPRSEIDRAVELERTVEEAFPAYLRPTFQLGVLLMYTDQLDEARPLLEGELARVTAAGDEPARAGVLLRLSELEWRAGNWHEAFRHARESRTLSRQASIEQEQSMILWINGLVAAHLGLEDEARQAAEEALALAQRARDTMVELRNRGTLGFLELSLGRPDMAHEHLGPAAARLVELGVGEFSITQVVHNEIEALAALGRAEQAEPLVEVLERAGRATGRAWSLAMGARGRAVVLAAEGRLEEALDAVDEALTHHEGLPHRFELGRTQMVRGTIQRRMKRWGEARRTLSAALEVFDGLGAARWAERAGAELSRIGGRAPRTGELTATERRIAELVAEGRSNPEVAAALFVAVRTVEWNLSKVYAKLGVRSRTELVGRLRELGPAQGLGDLDIPDTPGPEDGPDRP